MPICCYPFLPTILLEQYIGCVEKSEKSVKKDISREQHGTLQSKAVGATYSTEKASMGAAICRHSHNRWRAFSELTVFRRGRDVQRHRRRGD